MFVQETKDLQRIKKRDAQRRGKVRKKYKWFSKKDPMLKALEKIKKEEKKQLDLADQMLKNLIKKIEREKMRRKNKEEGDQTNFREL
jgi:hypothetical protein